MAMIERAHENTDLQFVQIITKLLKSFFERDEACGNFRCCSAPRLHHPFLVQKSLEPKLELRRV